MPTSWHDFPDNGFPRGRRQHRNSIGQSYATAPADAVYDVDRPGNTRGCYDDICDYYGEPLDHPLRFFHPLWWRALQGHSSETIKIRPEGFWDDMQLKHMVSTANATAPADAIAPTHYRYTVPFSMLTSSPVDLEAYEPHLFKKSVFHWTTRDSRRGVYQTGYLRQGRDGLYLHTTFHLRV